MFTKKISFELKLDNDNSFNEKLNIMQFDNNSTVFKIKLFGSNPGYNLDLNKFNEAIAHFKRQDGSLVKLECKFIDKSNGLIEVVLNRRVTELVGVVDLRINLRSNTGASLSYHDFRFFIIENVLNDDTVIRTAREDYPTDFLLKSREITINSGDIELLKRKLDRIYTEPRA